MKLIIFVISLVFISTNIQAGPFDKLKDIAPVIDLVKKEEAKKKKEEEEKKKKEEEEKKKKEEEAKKLEMQKQKELKQKESLENFYKLFNDTGTILITENIVELDDFGDEIKNEKNYFISGEQEYKVTAYCDLTDLNRFPFNISTRFSKKLDYDVNRTSMYYGYITLKYKLGSGFKGSFSKMSITDIVNSNITGISRDKLHNFSIRGGEEPFNLNLNERKKSLSNGEITILIPRSNSDENYFLKFNPFHKSWSDFHKLKCGVES